MIMLVRALFLLTLTTPIIGWSQMYGNLAHDVRPVEWFHDLGVLSNQNYFVYGSGTSDGTNFGTYYAEIDRVTLDTVFTKPISTGTGGGTGSNSVLQIENDTIIVMSNEYSILGDMTINKVHAGDVIWSKTYSPVDMVQRIANGVVRVSDGYMVAGYINLSGASQALLVKFDLNGIFQWEQTFGGSQNESFFNIDTTSNDGVIMSGYTESFGAGGWDIYVVKADMNGVEEWSEQYGSANDDIGWVLSLTGGDYLVYGGSDLGTPQDNEGWVLKIDNTGAVIWDNYYGIDFTAIEYFIGAVELTDGSIVLSGNTMDVPNNNPIGWLVKLNASGTEIWSITHELRGNGHYPNNIISTPDSGFLIAGFVAPDAGLSQDGWLVKTDSLGCPVVGCQLVSVSEEENAALINVFPNPSTGSFLIEWPDDWGNIQLRIYNAEGKLILDKNQRGNAAIDISTQPSGLYLLQITSEKGTWREKLILDSR